MSRSFSIVPAATRLFRAGMGIAVLSVVGGLGVGMALAQLPPALRPRPFTVTDADRAYWAFQPVVRPAIPEAGSGSGAGSKSVKGHPIDAFLGERLREKGLELSSSASPRELVRRAYFDLLGLPPAPEVVEAFERDPSDAAWESLVTGLLASPAYGERWGRHWLDLVRYAESNGYERDGPKPNAWRYRDYVIRSLNEDKPYDRFVREQIAGDELAEGLPAGSPEWRDAIVATGFYRLHVWDDEPDSTLQAEFDDLDDIMVTTGTAFLGLTVGCARCHDHKFDPVSQADYYSLLSFVRSIDPYGQHHEGGGGRGTGRIERPLASEQALKSWENARKSRVAEADARLKAASDPETKKRFEDEIRRIRDERPPFDYALSVAEKGPTPKPTHVLYRGDVHSPRDEVRPAFPAVFGITPPALPERGKDASTTGRRRVLADWVADARNPLTARVAVNRLWQHHFGAGLVGTPDDFGLTGLPPSNRALLDYLAWELVEGGWRLKRMHRLILTSRAYRMSSRSTNREALAVDEGNSLFWRQNLRRLEAEAIRDTILAVAGRLNSKAGGPSVFPSLPKEVHGTQDSSGKGWQDSPLEEQNRRSVYLVVKRALKIPLLECFDFANSASGTGTRPVTTTAPQGLMLMNDDFVQRMAEALAARTRLEAGESTPARVTRALRLAWQRSPSTKELALAEKFIAETGAKDNGKTGDAAFVAFCRAVLNASETIYVD
jgi:hypothetical protein